MSDKIAIYPYFGQHMSSWNVNCAKGCYTIQLLKSTDNDSLILFNIDNSDINTVYYNLVEHKGVFNVGDEVSISGEIGTYEKYVVGKIVSIQNDYIEIVSYTDHKTRTHRIKDYKQVSVNEVSKNSYISVELTDLRGELQLSYLFNDIGWTSHYTLIFNDDNIELFKMIGKVTNSNGNLSGYITLVAGSISKPRQESSRIRSMSLEAVPSSVQKSEITESKFEEYYRYDIGDKCIKDTTNIELISVNNLDSTKYYIHDVSSHDRVTYGYEMIAPKFLPTGDIYLYHRTNGGIIYSGTSTIDEAREGDKINLMVGKTTQVQINSNVSGQTVDKLDDKNYQTNVTINSKAKNLTEKSVNIELKYYIGNSQVISIDLEPTKRENGYLIWGLMLDPSNTIVSIKITMIISN